MDSWSYPHFDLFFAWNAIFVGVYWDSTVRALFVLPVPCFGVRIRIGP